jgi:iron complex outermembrane receptor protein
VYGERARDGGFALGELDMLRERPHHVNQDFEGDVERDLIAPSVTWTHSGDSMELVTITSYNDWDVLETSDFDFTPIDGIRRSTSEDQQYFYQEVRLSSARGPGEGGETGLAWVAGASLFDADSQRDVANDFRPDGAGIFFPPAQVGVDTNTGDFDDLGYGVFGQATLTVASDFDLTAGLRWDFEDKEADLRHTFEVGGVPFVDESNDFDEDFDEVLPHFGAAWRVREDMLAYATASKGYKAGGFNLNAPAGSFAFDTETSWAYELGVKKSFAEERVHVSAAAFYIDWEDQQLSLFDPAVGGYIANAGEATSQGVEIEADARVGAGWTVFGGFGLLDTEIEEFVDNFGQDTSGNDLPFAPETTWNAGAQYERDLPWGPEGDKASWFVRAEYVAVGDFAYDAGNLEQESYDLTNLRAGIQRGALALDVWVRNAFDEEYFPVAFQANPADPSFFLAESGAPRTFGVTLRGSF